MNRPRTDTVFMRRACGACFVLPRSILWSHKSRRMEHLIWLLRSFRAARALRRDTPLWETMLLSGDPADWRVPTKKTTTYKSVWLRIPVYYFRIYSPSLLVWIFIFNCSFIKTGKYISFKCTLLEQIFNTVKLNCCSIFYIWMQISWTFIWQKKYSKKRIIQKLYVQEAVRAHIRN